MPFESVLVSVLSRLVWSAQELSQLVELEPIPHVSVLEAIWLRPALEQSTSCHRSSCYSVGM